jgi:hypothetical protein
MIEMLA